MAVIRELRSVPWMIIVVISLAGVANCALDRPILLWTQKSHIWSKFRGLPGDPSTWMDMNLKPYIQSESSDGAYKYALGFDPKKNIIYWSDRKSFTINKQELTDTIVSKTANRTSVIYRDKDSEIHGIAVDWMTGNTYFTEAWNKWIAVVSGKETTGNTFRILFSSNLEAPSGIAVDPVKGLLFWSDSPGAATSSPKIERSTTDGRGRRVLAAGDMERPLGVAVNPEEERVYWVDRDLGRVESVRYDGTDRTRSVEGGQGMSFRGLALYKDYVFVTTEDNLALIVYSKAERRLVKKVDIDAIPYYPVIIDTITENPKHDCEDKPCSELCLNTGPGNGVCECSQGYYLQLDGTSCGSSKPKFIYSVGKTVLSADVTIKDKAPHVLAITQKVVADDMKKVQAIGFHYDRDMIFFSDTEQDVIYRSSSSGAGRKELTAQTSLVEGIAVDWTSDVVYWSDAVFGYIMVAKLSGHFHRILIEKDVADTPKDIAVDAANRYMFWVSGEEQKGVIKRAKLDGSDVMTVVMLSENSSPQGLVVDARMKRLYWVDTQALMIECVDLHGGNRRMVTEAPEYGLYDVTVFQDYTTWTEGDKGLQFGMVRSGEKLQGVWSNDDKTEPYTASYDVVTFDIYLQPPTTNDCMKNNGGCSQLCYPVSNGARCGCGIGFILNATDQKTCNSNVTKTDFAFFVDPYHKQIYQLSHSGPPEAVHGVPLHTLEYPTSMDYDSAGETFYWIDRDKAAIRRGGINGEGTETVHTQARDSRPEKIGLDPINRHLYYSDSLKQGIYRMDLPGGGNHQNVVGDITGASVFTVDYEGGMLYWFNVDKIESSDLSGVNRETVVNDVRNVTCITFYHDDQMLYYGDSARGEIRARNVTTDEQTTLIDGTVRVRPVHALAASQEFLYFSIWNEKAVYRIDRQTGADETVIHRPIFARITDLRAIDARLAPVAAPPDEGLNWIIIVGAIAGALLFLLLLLAIIFGARRGCKKKSKESQTEAPEPEDDSFDPPVGNGNGYRNGDGEQSGFDAPITTIHGPPPPRPETNGHVPNGNAPNGHLSNGHSAYDDPALDEYSSIEYMGTDGGGPASPPPLGHTAAPALGHTAPPPLGPAYVPVIPPPPVLAPGPPPVLRNKLKRKPQPPPKPSKDSNNFQFATSAARDTMIQRLASRLRKGISSIRWSRGDGGDGEGGPGGSAGPGGNTAKDKANRKKRSSRFEALVNPKGGDGTGKDYVEPAKPVPKRVKKKGDYPLKTHDMPRGFAPASHCVPVIVRTTWGNNKAKAAEDEEEEEENVQ